jgi:hypothetical protein
MASPAIAELADFEDLRPRQLYRDLLPTRSADVFAANPARARLRCTL